MTNIFPSGNFQAKKICIVIVKDIANCFIWDTFLVLTLNYATVFSAIIMFNNNYLRYES